MSATQRQALVIARLKGRDGSTPSELAIPADKAKEMTNVDLYRAVFARKRNGCQAVFGETTSEEATGIIASLISHVPGADETAREFWKVSTTPLVQRLAGGVAWSSPSLIDAPNANYYDVFGVSFNGKLYLFYNSAQDRLHVWDTSTVRRVGLATPAAATVANSAGAGTYPATLRYYRVAYTEVSGSTIVRRSLSSAAVSFTPDGAHLNATITKPAAITEGETHWEIYVSPDGNLYFLLATVVVGTGTYTDTADPFAAIGGTPIPLDGAHTFPVSAKYGLVDGNRLILAGSWETTTATSRVWFTPRLGSGEGDSERIPDTVDQENWIDLDEKDGDAITGLGGPFEGMPIVFKYRHIWGLRATGAPDAPYQPLIISKVVGSIRQQMVVMAEDENNDPAIYFWSHRGPYRFGIRGLQYLGEDLKDIIERVNLDATTVTGFAVHHSDKHQIWYWLSVDTGNAPTLLAIFDTRLGEPDEDNQVRDGWTIFDGVIADARCAVMFSKTLGTSMSRTLKPYIGSSTVATLLRGDSGLLDNGAAYAGLVTLPEKHLSGLTRYSTVDQVIVTGSAGPHTFQVQMSRDYGCETRTSDVTMSAETGDQTRTQKTIEAAFQADAKSVGARIGDLCPTGEPWTIDALVIQYEPKQEITG